MMQIEDGKTYVSLKGDKVGPMRASPDGNYFWLGRSYTKSGHYNADGEPHPFDLVAEWREPAPVQEPPTDHVLQFFAFEHLPPALKEISRPFGQMAASITKTLPRNPERTVALRKLLEAKDAAVRAFIAK